MNHMNHICQDLPSKFTKEVPESHNQLEDPDSVNDSVTSSVCRTTLSTTSLLTNYFSAPSTPPPLLVENRFHFSQTNFIA